MAKKQNIKVILEKLYKEVDDFHEIQEQLIDSCFKLDKVESEIELYEKMNMPELLNDAIIDCQMEKKRLLGKKDSLEKMTASFDIDNIIQLIDKYEEQSV